MIAESRDWKVSSANLAYLQEQKKTNMTVCRGHLSSTLCFMLCDFFLHFLIFSEMCQKMIFILHSDV